MKWSETLARKNDEKLPPGLDLGEIPSNRRSFRDQVEKDINIFCETHIDILKEGAKLYEYGRRRRKTGEGDRPADRGEGLRSAGKAYSQLKRDIGSRSSAGEEGN